MTNLENPVRMFGQNWCRVDSSHRFAAINGRDVTARAINRLATWMLEHPEHHQDADQISLTDILREPSISMAEDLGGQAASERLSSVSILTFVMEIDVR